VEVYMAEKQKLGEMLMDAGFIDTIQLRSALGYQSQWGMRLGAALIDMKFITEETLVPFLEQQLHTKYVDIMSINVQPEAMRLLPEDMAKNYGVFPIKVDEKGILLATADPLDLPTLDELSLKLKKRIVPYLALESEIKRAILLHYGGVDSRETVPEPNMVNMRVLDHTQITRDEGEEPKFPRPVEPERKEFTTQHLVEAMIRALEKKGILSRSDIFKELE